MLFRSRGAQIMHAYNIYIYIYYMNDVECVRIYSVQLKQCLLSYQMPTPTALDESGITLSRWEQC